MANNNHNGHNGHSNHNSHGYGWQQRSPQPHHPSTMPMDQQGFTQSNGLPPHPGYAAGAGVGYPQHHQSAPPNYQGGPPSSQYFYPQHPGAPQTRQPRGNSASLPYSFPTASTVPPSTLPISSPAMQEHVFTPSPPSYLVNQHDYYLPHGSSVPSNAGSIAASPQPQPLMSSGTVYSSPESTPVSTDIQNPRVVSYRPKPQCFDHGCNGREFSTFSNLLRHQREKSGVVAKAECPNCGAVFTRTTARNIHVSQDKCKGVGRESST
ncbi:hypothetical protein ASPVEDRAFT_477575 [Aspergillus versicolor CBS 583.65]|uniref:C2H2-type domain-containing protein n=1 Tax=Aspergillus versicolor CBS 583.65 TaxID=1036611 RepID=A0A1L9PB06_ASPVE|nr:uncharacterized protein ASPVEDRAFT_477575 [Aspergillus versicolor CBS 583.65]OJI98634.1 hypothetical protein ASPVEDRAFT_477575 [Aspergillus versicolor CBS 583.65]